MTSITRPADAPRSPVFNAVSAGLVLLSLGWVLIIVSTPENPYEMMVPWARTVNMLQALVGAACVTLIWLRYAWAFYVYVGVFLFGILVGLMLRLPWPYLAIGPFILGLYLWALHTGSPSMWVQLFGRTNAPGGRSIAYGHTPAMPPTRQPVAAATMPPIPPAAPATAPAAHAVVPPAPTPTASSALTPIEALKRLAALRDAGALTEAEFTAKKAELLQRL